MNTRAVEVLVSSCPCPAPPNPAPRTGSARFVAGWSRSRSRLKAHEKKEDEDPFHFLFLSPLLAYLPIYHIYPPSTPDRITSHSIAHRIVHRYPVHPPTWRLRPATALPRRADDLLSAWLLLLWSFSLLLLLPLAPADPLLNSSTAQRPSRSATTTAR